MKGKIIYLVMAVVLIFSLSSCITTPEGEQTGETRYLTASRWFNDNYKQYLDMYDSMCCETKAKWKAEIDPLFKTASDALDAWGAVIGTGDADNAEDTYMALKSQLLLKLIEIGIIEIEENK